MYFACHIMWGWEKFITYEKIAYMAESMNKDRLGFLAIMNIHKDMEIDCQEVVKKFFELHPWKLSENYLISV